MGFAFNPFTGNLDNIGAEHWSVDSPGIRYTGHIAVGADADVNGSGQVNSILQDILGVGTTSTVAYLQETFTGTPATWNSGLNIKAVANFGSAATGVFGAEILGATLSGNAQNVTLLAGLFGGARHSGTGTITNAYGVPGAVYNRSTGTIGVCYGLYGSITNSGGGTINNAYTLYGASVVNSSGTVTNAYGLYLEAQTAGAASYNIYSAGLASRNYFAGYVETDAAGGFYLGTTGSVNNRFLLNTPQATDSTAEQINTPSSTARKALVLQMRSGQTASALEVQDNSGNVLSHISPTGQIGALTTTTAMNASAALQVTGNLYFTKEAARTIQMEDTTTANTAGAAFSIIGAAGSNTTGGTGGALSVVAGAGRAGNAGGGALTLTGGAGVGVSTGGAVNITGGAGLTGGAVVINGGNGFTDGYIRIGSTDGLVTLGHANTPNAHLDIRSRVASTTALSVDNVAVSAAIADFKDNGSSVWTIADGGALTAAEGINMIFGTATGTKIGTATTQKIGFWNATPAVQPSAYTATNVTTDRSFDANATSINELADVLGTLITDLKTIGLLG
jgi:hypothetical protein